MGNLDDTPFKGQLKKIMKKVSDKKKTDAAATKVVNALLKGVGKGGKGGKSEDGTIDSSTAAAESPFRLGRALAHGHKPPCICPDKCESVNSSGREL